MPDVIWLLRALVMHTLSSQGLGSHLRLSKISVLYTRLYWSILIKSNPCLGSPPEVEFTLDWHTFGNYYLSPLLSLMCCNPITLCNTRSEHTFLVITRLLSEIATVVIDIISYSFFKSKSFLSTL